MGVQILNLCSIWYKNRDFRCWLPKSQIKTVVNWFHDHLSFQVFFFFAFIQTLDFQSELSFWEFSISGLTCFHEKALFSRIRISWCLTKNSRQVLTLFQHHLFSTDYNLPKITVQICEGGHAYTGNCRQVWAHFDCASWRRAETPNTGQKLQLP